MTQTNLIQRLTDGLPITAGSFIVTVYGDVVVPRGEVLWIGSLIDLCARIGISESLVRTAVSRLVAADRLEGERVGRRSFYRLAPAARAEFARAARLLYARPQPSGKWLVVLAPDMPEDLARRHRMARMAGDVWICPARDVLPEAGLVLEANPVSGQEKLPQLGDLWNISDISGGYNNFLDRFKILAEKLPLSPEDALIARLLLVHQYRAVLLRDPGLPAQALPADWPGHRAQDLFRVLYPALTPLAEAQIAQMMEGEDGPLPENTARTQARLQALA